MGASPSASVAVTAAPTLAPVAAFSATLRVTLLAAKAGGLLAGSCFCCCSAGGSSAGGSGCCCCCCSCCSWAEAEPSTRWPDWAGRAGLARLALLPSPSAMLPRFQAKLVGLDADAVVVRVAALDLVGEDQHLALLPGVVVPRPAVAFAHGDAHPGLPVDGHGPVEGDGHDDGLVPAVAVAAFGAADDGRPGGDLGFHRLNASRLGFRFRFRLRFGLLLLLLLGRLRFRRFLGFLLRLRRRSGRGSRCWCRSGGGRWSRRRFRLRLSRFRGFRGFGFGGFGGCRLLGAVDLVARLGGQGRVGQVGPVSVAVLDGPVPQLQPVSPRC